jgi:inner membrane protease ATP23
MPSTPASATPPAPHSAPSGEVGSLQNDPARTRFDPSTSFWLNYFRSITGQMTPEGRFHFREHVYREQEEKDCRRCEDYRDWLLQFSPTVRFMADRINALNGKLDASNIMCRRCPARLMPDGQVRRQAGGFDPNHGILICANEIRDRKHLEDTLSHEMVHAWDHLRWKVDWYGDQDLRHAACTEVGSICPVPSRPWPVEST